ncbi:MAG: DUF2917 domain-containing protein [Proteobacteria bacterium]|nr:MAG: DUF2917 domain-containing protein [Pseudomonadota bacterium]
MNNVKQSHLILERGQILKLESFRQAIQIDCAVGSAWVTTSRDNQDHVLKTGERFELPPGSALIIEGLQGRLEIDIKECA